MGQVAVNLNGRSYRFDCGDGEEPRLKELAAHVKSRYDSLVREYGNVGEDRLLLMAALLIADELWDARAASADEGSRKQGASDAKTGAQKRDQDALRATPGENKKSA